MNWIKVHGTLLKGHGVASGRGGDPRFPGGTIRMQLPHFAQRGLELSSYHPGTLNVSIEPHTYTILQPKLTLRNVKWHPTAPAEDFSFFDCRIQVGDSALAQGLVYYPHPETKPEHFQPPDVLEILAPPIPNIAYGAPVVLELLEEQIRIG
jgi:hypothetical protein